MKVHHPAFPDLIRDVKHVGQWIASGWIPEATEELHPCPTCGAVKDEPCLTISGVETARHVSRD